MRVAGVGLDDGTRIWVDAGDRALHPLDRVDVQVDGDVQRGTVFVVPEQIVLGQPNVEATLLGVHPQAVHEIEDDLPGDDMPPLGSMLSIGGVDGMVVRIDAVNRTVQIRSEHGGESLVAWHAPEGSRRI